MWYEENFGNANHEQLSYNGSFDGENGSIQGELFGDNNFAEEREPSKFQRQHDLSSMGYTKDHTALGPSVMSPDKASQFDLSFQTNTVENRSMSLMPMSDQPTRQLVRTAKNSPRNAAKS